jgi:hypothetical protein
MADRSTLQGAGREAAPFAALKWGALAAVSLLVAGAVYLMIVRGPALILDLAAMSKYLICF